MMLAVAAVAAGAAFADVQSSNIVGYQNFSNETAFTEQGLAQPQSLGIAFYNVAEAEKTFTITDTFCGRAVTDYDTIMIFNSDPNLYNYDLYCYMGKDIGWYWQSADLVTDDTITSVTVNKGDCIVYVPIDTSVPLTVSGEVEDISKPFTLTFDLEKQAIFPLVNPFPRDTKLKEVTAFAHDYDTVMIFNSDPNLYNYDLYCYMGKDIGWYWQSADLVTDDTITDGEMVLLKAGQGGVFVPVESTTWEVSVGAE